MCAVLVITVIGSSVAQTRNPKRRTTTGTSAYDTNPQTKQNNTAPKTDTTVNPNSNTGSAYGSTTDTTVNPNNNSGSAYGDAGNNNMGIDTSLPIEVITTTSNGLLDSGKMSLRNDAAVNQNLMIGKTPLPYEPIREDDAVFRARVWREIDAREKMNLPFLYAGEADNGNQRFISILLRAIKDGELTAFSGDDDRFTTPITADVAIAAFGSGNDTVPTIDREGNVVGYQVRPKAIDPDSIYKFRIKEEWIFDKENSRLFVRILGIAPVMPFYLTTGEPIPNSDRPLWWVYYPDARTVLAKNQVYNPRNFASKISWDDLFESRMFSSYIVQSTYDNPFNLPLSAVYPNNTLFRLLEGERIKDRIFNYEQSLWSY